MKRLTDQQFNRRISELKSSLEQTANRHSDLLDELRPKQPHQWTCDGMMEPGGDSVIVTARINTITRPPLSLDS